MAPTEGRVARPERRWGCRRGTSSKQQCISQSSATMKGRTMQIEVISSEDKHLTGNANDQRWSNG